MNLTNATLQLTVAASKTNVAVITLNLGANNTINVNVPGSALAAGSYRLMDCGAGTVTGSAVNPTPTITGTPFEQRLHRHGQHHDRQRRPCRSHRECDARLLRFEQRGRFLRREQHSLERHGEQHRRPPGGLSGAR